MTHRSDERGVIGVKKSDGEGEATLPLSVAAINAQILRHMDALHRRFWNFIWLR